MNHIILKQVSCEHEDFACLCSELDDFLNRAIGGECKREKYKKFNCLETMDYVVVAYEDEEAIGCAALREYSKESIEVKRVFVRAECRGKNVGGLLMEHLISCAKSRKYKNMILETGAFLEASVRLYSRYGFERITNYGAYKDMPESLCMGRSVEKGRIIYCQNRWIEAGKIRELFSSAGWLSADYADRLTIAFRHAGTVISAWRDEKLLGLAEVLDDGEVNAYIHYLLVCPAYQNQGIGSHMVEMIKQKYRNYLYVVVICEKKNAVPFYVHNGFSTATDATPLQIRTL